MNDTITQISGLLVGHATNTVVVNWLHERGYNFDTGIAKEPVIPTAGLVDLAEGVTMSGQMPTTAIGHARRPTMVGRSKDGSGQTQKRPSAKSPDFSPHNTVAKFNPPHAP